jgi:lysophospholipase L1-like esterase
LIFNQLHNQQFFSYLEVLKIIGLFMNWETLLSLGDSITIGSRSYLGYPEYCGHFLKKGTNKDWNIINCAIAGFTTIDLVRHIDKNWINLTHTKPSIISILIGTNDIKSETSVEDFEIAYDQIILKAKLLVKSKNIILNKIPLLQNGVMLPYTIKMNVIIKKYNKVIQEIAEKESLLLIDMPESENLFYDGVHLNSLGSMTWGKNLCNKIIGIRNE